MNKNHVLIKPKKPNLQKIQNFHSTIEEKAKPFRLASLKKLSTYDALVQGAGEIPNDFIKPQYGTVEYWLAYKFGWIEEEKVAQDALSYQKKKCVALNTSNHYTSNIQKTSAPLKKTKKYIPSVSLDFALDRSLTPSAIRVMQVLLQEAYMYSRKNRTVPTTNSYISKITGYSIRTVSRAVRLLLDMGYIVSYNAASKKTGMSIGKLIEITSKCLPVSQEKKWPEKRRNPGVTRMTPNKNNIYKNILQNCRFTHTNLWRLMCCVKSQGKNNTNTAFI